VEPGPDVTVSTLDRDSSERPHDAQKRLPSGMAKAHEGHWGISARYCT
jgi:hypothetical protein